MRAQFVIVRNLLLELTLRYVALRCDALHSK